MKSKKVKRETWRTTDAEERAKRQERAKVEPTPVAKAEAKIPPEERLRAAVEAECPNVERMSVITTGVRENKCISKAIVVGRGVDKEKMARQIADTQGVALPNEAIETIDPETWQLMKRLEVCNETAPRGLACLSEAVQTLEERTCRAKDAYESLMKV